MIKQAGVLLSVSSLPSQEGIGTLGEGAYSFVDFLSSAGFGVWQVLPLTPTREGNSPYSSVCAGALNPLFIDLYDLVKRGLLKEKEIDFQKTEKVDYASLIPQKQRLLRLAFSRFDRTDKDFIAFEKRGEYWEYAAFSTLSEAFGNKPFTEWGDGYSVYDRTRTQSFLKAHNESYLFYLFTQYLFEKQWQALKAYANERGVKIFGDMPIYVAMNSAEVYFHPELFLFEEGKPKKVAGVPPDYFNSEGQRWGNPLYDWEKMKESEYDWWRKRILRELTRFDILRIDHFRGLDRFYAIDADAEDAKHGTWMPGPGADLFSGMTQLPIVAEDLGYIDESLRATLQAVGFPGMKVYEFGLDADPWSEHKPANYKENVVGYTGTHDNMPFRGFLDEAEGNDRIAAVKSILVQATVLGAPIPSTLFEKAKKVPDCESEEVLAARLILPFPEDPFLQKQEMQTRVDLIEGAKGEYISQANNADLTRIACATLLLSKARLVMFPMQDVLCLGAESRMNTPALVSNENWAWRLDGASLTPALASRIKQALQGANRV